MSQSVKQVCYWGNCSQGFTVKFLVTVDPLNVIQETNEANNTQEYGFFYKTGLCLWKGWD
jgi:subtilase family serine protease